jgi:hypothetical protein
MNAKVDSGKEGNKEKVEASPQLTEGNEDNEEGGFLRPLQRIR